MTIWQYADKVQDVDLVEFAISLSVCPFCGSNLRLLRHEVSEEGEGDLDVYHRQVCKFWACPVCGWWKVYKSCSGYDCGLNFVKEHGAAASLRNLDLSDISLPIEEVRAYLSAKYEERFNLHPRLFELVVASVFRDHGYEAEATAYTNDGGIDVVMYGREGQQVAVQVKRYKNSIGVDQIRSFAGALLISGITNGVFITTSQFQRGGHRAAEAAALRGISIELLDAPKFFDALRIERREMYSSTKDLEILADDGKAFVQLRNFPYDGSGTATAQFWK